MLCSSVRRGVRHVAHLHQLGASDQQSRELSHSLEEWAGQITAALTALRFPDDRNQVRAAVKFASRFDWVDRMAELTLAQRLPATVVEALTVVPHRGNLLVANCGRCQAFLLTPKRLETLNSAHPPRPSTAAVCRATAPAAPSSRALGAASPRTCMRPEVSMVGREEWVPGARIVAATPALLEALGAQAWQTLLLSCAHLPRQALLAQIDRAAAQAGITTEYGCFVYEATTSPVS